VGQPADDQGDVRPREGLPVPVPGRRVGRSFVLIAVVALAAAAAAGAARIHGTRHNDLIQAVNGKRDIVTCGRGRDVVTVEARDGVRRDCEIVTREISTDPYANPQSQHASEVEPDTASSGSTVVAVFQVGRIREGGAANIGWATSRDRGRTWKHGFLPGLTPSSSPAGPWPRATDPSITYDAQHGVWLAVSLTFGGADSALLISRSSDGIHWGQPVTATHRDTFGLDKQWIACDNWPSSPFRGRCYLSYDDLVSDQIETNFSTDGGLTWQGPTHFPGAGRDAINGPAAPGVQPAARPDGSVLIPYFDNAQMSVLRSVDGGMTWLPATPVGPASYHPVAGLRVAPLPSADVGVDGAVYVSWADCSRRANCSANDVVVARSADGITWGTPVRVSTGTADAELPGIAADPSGAGRLALTYYTVRNGLLDVYFTTSRSAGATWTKRQRLNSRSIPFGWLASAGGAMVGDYISTSFAGGRAVPVFALGFAPRRARLHESMFATSLALPH
jgi:hypothetical protein